MNVIKTSNVGVAGIIDYFITTPMTTVALIIVPKLSIEKTFSSNHHILQLLVDIISLVDPPPSSINNPNYSNDRIFKSNENKDKKYKKATQEDSKTSQSNQQNLHYIPGHTYKICDTQTFGTHHKKSLPLWEAEMICATEFVSICFNCCTTTPLRKMNQNQHDSIHIIGQENRLMPLYQAFDKYLNLSVEPKESNSGQNQSVIHLTVALPDNLDGTVAHQIINDKKINKKHSKYGMNKEETSIDDRIFPVIHEGMNISEVLEGIYHTKRVLNDSEAAPDNTKVDKKEHLKKPVDAIWLNYIDGKVFNARDLRHSKYWKDLNTVLKMMVEQRKPSKFSSKSINHHNDLNNVIIGITINYSNDSEYWEGASIDWLVQGVNEAILAALKDDANQSITKESTRLQQDSIEIEVLRVAKYVVGVPRLFLILSIHQFEKETEIKDCGASKKQNSNAVPNSIPTEIPKTPEVAQWQWHNKWPTIHDLLVDKKVEVDSLCYPNPHSPSPSTDRFRRVSPLICGLVKHIVSLKQKLAGSWWSNDAVKCVPQNTDLSISRQTNTRILVYEDGFQYVCPSLLKLQKTILSGLQISCCTEDPVQLFFLKEFAKSTECDDTKRLNVIQLPDKEIKHSNKTTQEKKICSTELLNVSSENLFTNQDGLILLIQGGCKRWKDMFGLNVTNWITDQDRDYRRKLLLQGNL